MKNVRQWAAPQHAIVFGGNVGKRPITLNTNVSIEDVGNTAAFLCSDLAAGITGQTVYVDAGYNIVGMSFSDKD